jgi:hypothetical protein
MLGLDLRDRFSPENPSDAAAYAGFVRHMVVPSPQQN